MKCIWWGHDYLKNEKSFEFFFVSQVLSVRHANQTSKNVADLTFKWLAIALIRNEQVCNGINTVTTSKQFIVT